MPMPVASHWSTRSIQVKHEPAAAVSVRILMASGAQSVDPSPMMLMNQEAEHALDQFWVGNNVNSAVANDIQDRSYGRRARSRYGVPPRSTLKGVAQVRTLKDGAARLTGKTGRRAFGFRRGLGSGSSRPTEGRPAALPKGEPAECKGNVWEISGPIVKAIANVAPAANSSSS
jgi:hypothetical protein